MAKNILSASSHGLRDWVIQRLSAVYILLYTIFIVACWWILPADYIIWRAFFFNHFTLFAANILLLLAIAWHAWIGGWTIITDYINCSILRATAKIILLLFLFANVLYGLMLFWYLFSVRGF